MKITTTITKEIKIQFPVFTKVIDGTIEHYFCLQSESKKTSFSKYINTNIYIFSKSDITYSAFKEGFVFIDKDEYFAEYENIVDTLQDDMDKLKLELEDETDEDTEDEGFEYNPETETMN